jgi:hypothetical protein
MAKHRTGFTVRPLENSIIAVSEHTKRTYRAPRLVSLGRLCQRTGTNQNTSDADTVIFGQGSNARNP